LRRGIFHCLNDIYAAAAIPKAFAVSYALPGRPNAELLSEIISCVRDVASLSGCSITKQHTSFGNASATMTVAAVGVSETQAVLAQEGSVFIAGSDDFANERKRPLDDNACNQERRIREFAARSKNVAMKDVSGDGLGGALWQLTEREDVAITVSKEALSSLSRRAPIDNCLIDKNYSDYGDFINGFHGNNTKEIRSVLFFPAFFGPLVGLCSNDSLDALPRNEFKVIGVYSAGRSSLRIV
jgi:thiamine monophosphate kinase